MLIYMSYLLVAYFTAQDTVLDPMRYWICMLVWFDFRYCKFIAYALLSKEYLLVGLTWLSIIISIVVFHRLS
jgi:hypothetical protein